MAVIGWIILGVLTFVFGGTLIFAIASFINEHGLKTFLGRFLPPVLVLGLLFLGIYLVTHN